MDGNGTGAGTGPRRRTRAAAHLVTGFVVLGFLLAGCSAGGGINLPAFDAGSGTAASPPVIQGNEPAGQFAFVYGNQIWVKLAADSRPRQLTHLPVVSSGEVWAAVHWSGRLGATRHPDPGPPMT